MSTVKILLVDDEEIVRITLEAYLEDEGYTVITANSGEEALERIVDQNMDVGIIDMRLPGIDGNVLISKLNKLQPEMKFIIHTGSMGYSLPESLTALGISDELVFKKPIKSISEFTGMIRKLTEGKV
ncbi:MAG: response regulator [Candidatus Aminicenantes bacterium]|nr:response regulator [Candidatus Aminicenantes bacterium]